MLTSRIVSSGQTVQRMLNRHTSSTIFGVDNKLIREPSRILEFLGLHFSLEQALISPPKSFLETLTSVLSRLSTSTIMSAHKIISINSRISHFTPYIHHGRLQLRFLQFSAGPNMLNRGTVQSNWTRNIFHISIGSAIWKYYREFQSTLRNPTFSSSRMPLW